MEGVFKLSSANVDIIEIFWNGHEYWSNDSLHWLSILIIDYQFSFFDDFPTAVKHVYETSTRSWDLGKKKCLESRWEA